MKTTRKTLNGRLLAFQGCMLLMGVALSLGAAEGAWRVEVREPGGGWRAVETELVLTADGHRNLHVVPDEVSAVYDGPARWSRHAGGRACANHVVKAACARIPWRDGLAIRVQGPDAAARVKALGLGAQPLAEGTGGFTFRPAGPVKAMALAGDDAIRTLSLFVEAPPERPDFSKWKHVIRFPRGAHAPGVVRVTNDCTLVWLDAGARLDAAIDIDGARRVRVAGPGTIDQYPRCFGYAGGFREKPLWGVYRDGELPAVYIHGNAEDVTVENLLVKSAFRGVCVRNAKGVTLRDLKVFTSNMNGDGFNAVNLQGLVARDLYVHAQDDAFCAYANADSIKYLWDGDAAVRQRRTGDFLVEDSIFWTSCRPFVFSGHGTGNRAEPDLLENITIRRSSVVGSVYGCEAPSSAAVEPFAGCFRINSQSGTWTRNVLFEDIDFYWTKGFRSQALCLEVRDAAHASYGESDGYRIEGVTWRDVRFHGIPADTARSSKTVQPKGRPGAGIFGVRVENVTYDGRPVDPFAVGPVREGLSYDGTSPQKDERDIAANADRLRPGASVFESKAAVVLPGLFGDHAVIQRDARASVWGRASAGERVRVSLGGASAEAVAAPDGWFLVRLDTTGLGDGPHELTAVSRSGRAVSRDVLVGEVWLAAGQSNMELTMKGWAGPIWGYDERVRACTNRPIRVFREKRATRPTPVKGDARGEWRLATPETLPQFSAVGYCFIDTLQRRLGSPAGVVDISWSGTRCWGWMPRACIDRHAELRAERLAQESYLANDDPGAVKKPVSVCWNNMFAPLEKIACRGIIWYQGCCDSSMLDAERLYPKWMSYMVAEMRRALERPNLPFLYVQIAGWGDAPASPGEDKPRAHLREAQRLARALIPNAHMAVSLDQSEKEIHNRGKSAVGDRLAALALNRVYGFGDVACLSPEAVAAVRDGAAVRVTFETEGAALKAGEIRASFPWDAKHAEEIPLPRRSSPASELEGFVLRDADGAWHWADAVIVAPDAVRVSAPGVTRPTAVRYAWGGQGFGNLVNTAGLPAGPFSREVK